MRFLVGVAGDARDDVGVFVEDVERLGSERVVAEDNNPPVGRELLVEPGELARVDARLRGAGAVDGCRSGRL